jgi:predicted GNAT family acetyltransferase
MAWILTDDLDEYCAAAGDFLTSRPVQHTIQLSAIAAIRSRGRSAYGPVAPLYGWWSDSGPVASALLHTLPYPLLLTELPDGGARTLASELVVRGRVLPGVNAPEPDAFAFGDAWCAITGLTARVFRRSRLFRLAELVPPSPAPPGAARVAGADDLAIAQEMAAAFAAEVNEPASLATAAARERVSEGGTVLWETGGAPVAMAAVTPPAAGVSRVGPVYTPPGQRGRGYGGAVTATVSQLALARGADQVVLFTDLANPTSNALYQRLGYRPVSDRVVLTFESRVPSA